MCVRERERVVLTSSSFAPLFFFFFFFFLLLLLPDAYPAQKNDKWSLKSQINSHLYRLC